ncbi:MAG: DNA cytosine methyltransferase [Acidimicrobiia bacterium]|nr:DNA cytosine methyltransferase [Acidimicrobiia bacterium]MYB72373.1 DNA cytosine methyltransferase [Acidimicrobiia bacterium]MYH97985.1 DNA cytosine methyltransferase [Acidimicrobiia bacterium]
MRAAEFFAGMGLMRAGLERVGVTTVFANDIDTTKAALYRSNWGDDVLVVEDIRNLHGDDIPDAEIATASFPCVDMSLAGNLAGLDGEQSGLITEFCRILIEMGERRPRAVIVENVPGFATVNGGRDFAQVVEMLESLGYAVNSIVVNASAFVPQSRARVFLLGALGEQPLLPEVPKAASLRLVDVASAGGDWWPPDRRDAFLESLSPLQRERIESWHRDDRIRFLGAYRRTRNGRAVWEVRSDEIAGALRTTRGGSSRQALVRVGRDRFDVRWMDVDEYARLQGAETLNYDSVSERQAMFALGDAVCVPVIEWLGQNWLMRLAA